MEQTPKRRLIIRKKLVPKEGDESLLPPKIVTRVDLPPITDSTLKKCPCGGYYTSDSEYTPRECCSGLYTQGVRYNWVGGRYTPDYTPTIDDFTSDKSITTKANTTTKDDKIVSSGFTIMPASQLRQDTRDSREDRRDYRETQRDYRNTSRDYRNTQRDSRETQRDYRQDSRDSRQDTRDYRNTSRDSRQDSRDSREDRRNDRDYHRSREREYVRTARVTDEPNSYNGARREPSKFKSELDSELGKYNRKF